jgi:hypothetical protein
MCEEHTQLIIAFLITRYLLQDFEWHDSFVFLDFEHEYHFIRSLSIEAELIIISLNTWSQILLSSMLATFQLRQQFMY